MVKLSNGNKTCSAYDRKAYAKYDEYSVKSTQLLMNKMAKNRWRFTTPLPSTICEENSLQWTIDF